MFGVSGRRILYFICDKPKEGTDLARKKQPWYPSVRSHSNEPLAMWMIVTWHGYAEESAENRIIRKNEEALRFKSWHACINPDIDLLMITYVLGKVCMAKDKCQTVCQLTHDSRIAELFWKLVYLNQRPAINRAADLLKSFFMLSKKKQHLWNKTKNKSYFWFWAPYSTVVAVGSLVHRLPLHHATCCFCFPPPGPRLNKVHSVMKIILTSNKTRFRCVTSFLRVCRLLKHYTLSV